MNNQAESFFEYRNLLFSIAYNMLGQVEAAQDIVQDTFLVSSSSTDYRPSFPASMACLLGWSRSNRTATRSGISISRPILTSFVISTRINNLP